jgi:hypothetical protein
MLNAELSSAISQMMTSDIGGWLVGIGLIIYGIVGGCRLTMFGLEAVSAGWSTQIAHRFYRLLMRYAAGFIALSYWARPLPGLGVPVPGLLNSLVDEILKTITALTTQDLMYKMTLFEQQIGDWPSWTNTWGLFCYVVVTAFAMVLQALGFLLTAAAYISAAVATILGPIFIATMLWPSVDWAFRGWLRAWVQLSTLPITVTLIASVVGNFCWAVLSATPHAGAADVAQNFFMIVLVMLTGVGCMLTAPLVHNWMFSGASGGHHNIVSGTVGKLGSLF